MIEVEHVGFLSEIRGQTKYRTFPSDEFEVIKTAVEDVSESVFLNADSGTELKLFDKNIAHRLDDYHHEHDHSNGRNPSCKLWESDGFDYSVDLYHQEKRIAIEIEKSERKRISDDILKFIKGGKTQRSNRKKIEFGCLIVPVNYRSSGNLFKESMRTLKFIRSILFVEDVAVIGYRDPRW